MSRLNLAKVEYPEQAGLAEQQTQEVARKILSKRHQLLLPKCVKWNAGVAQRCPQVNFRAFPGCLCLSAKHAVHSDGLEQCGNAGDKMTVSLLMA